ncbi:MAG: hypothetical protein HRT52_03745 [Colwellia sp.]|nr:hypothetical protein [Colwellia sp.]
MKTIIFAIILSSLLTACTSKEIYNATQINRQSKCNEEVGVLRDKCLESLNKKSYEDYERERKDIIKPKH